MLTSFTLGTVHKLDEMFMVGEGREKPHFSLYGEGGDMKNLR